LAKIIADGIAFRRGNVVGHAVQGGIQSAHSGGDRVDIQRGNVSRPGHCRRNRDDAAAAANIDHVQALNRLWLIQDIACQRLPTDPGKRPERRPNIGLVQVGFGCVPQRR